MTATEPTEAITGVPFTLNGQKLTANEGELLIEACDRNDVHIPRFCHHKRMKPVGMCRMCLVEVDTGRGPALQPSCMLPVTPEMVVETESEATKDAQDGVLELLLANHPLDCPVCDKGGECPLQDNAYAYGPGESRFVEEKRHFEKPIPISDLVNLDRERCILCDRCTRFAADVAGDPLIHFIDRGSQTQVNTFPDHSFASYFSGNTVQICPVGALTSEPYRFKARPWDLEETESTAAVDSSGARVILQSSQDRLVRTLGVDSDAVNWSWLSDKERFIYEAANSQDRVVDPLLSDGDDFNKARWNDALDHVKQALQVSPDRIGVIGGARSPLEGQYAWAKLFKGLIGTDNVDAQLGDGLPAPLVLGLPRTTISEGFAPGSTVVILSPDPKEIVPSIFLRLRHAVVEDGVTLVEISERASSLTPFAEISIQVKPGSIGQVTSCLVDGTVKNIKDQVACRGKFAKHNDVLETLERAASLIKANNPVTVLLGRINIAESVRYTTDAIAAIVASNENVKFLPALRRGNSVGALEMGLTPGYMPGGASVPSDLFDGWAKLNKTGFGTAQILNAAAAGEIETLVLIGADPIGDFPDNKLALAALSKVKNLIAIDCFLNASSSRANVVLPVAMHGEVKGSFMNLEGRLSPLLAKVTPPGQARSDWTIATEVAEVLGHDIGFDSLEDLRSDLSSTVERFADIDWQALQTSEDGPIVSASRSWNLKFNSPADVPQDTGRNLRLLVDNKLWDQGTMLQGSATLSGLAENFKLRLCPEDVADLGLGDAVEANIISGAVSQRVAFVADSLVPKGTAWAPAHLPGLNVTELISVADPVVLIQVSPIEGAEDDS